MKDSTPIRFGPALLGILLLSAITTNAHTVQSRLAFGVVERLDTASRTVQLSPKDGKAPTELALTSRTKFIHNWHFAQEDELKEGTSVMVYYRMPIFGKPFVTKVVWLKGK